MPLFCLFFTCGTSGEGSRRPPRAGTTALNCCSFPAKLIQPGLCGTPVFHARPSCPRQPICSRPPDPSSRGDPARSVTVVFSGFHPKGPPPSGPRRPRQEHAPRRLRERDHRTVSALPVPRIGGLRWNDSERSVPRTLRPQRRPRDRRVLRRCPAFPLPRKARQPSAWRWIPAWVRAIRRCGKRPNRKSRCRRSAILRPRWVLWTCDKCHGGTSEPRNFPSVMASCCSWRTSCCCFGCREITSTCCKRPDQGRAQEAEEPCRP